MNFGATTEYPYLDYLYTHKYVTPNAQDVNAICNDRSKIVCPSFEKEKQLYVLKRFNGKMEYFRRPQDFSSLPAIDIRNLAKVRFINMDEIESTNRFMNFLKDQCDKYFIVLKPVKGKCYRYKYVLDPVKKDPRFLLMIVRESGDLFILDPMNLLKFGTTDMTVLFQNSIKVVDGYDQKAKPFTKVVALAITNNLYDGTRSFRTTLDLG
ncbi:hypothetical protein E3N88_18165 [Mikania micrantha]|uniref:Uncharacterized protein n=1 Tax=Mikania micrantha TaxID=192012 RepID=A0A5N6NVA1_9ASTR|nr:hypothetical protein E3N88_18165 [Mikania micrantha]